MLALKWLSVLALAALAASTGTDVPELSIDKTYVPTDCPAKSQKGDKIRVHYVSRDLQTVPNSFSDRPSLNLQTGKLTNGKVFDSRCVCHYRSFLMETLLTLTRMQR